MNIDQARAGGEGMISKQDTKKKMKDGPPIFESEDKEVELVVPDGWKTKEQFKEQYRDTEHNTMMNMKPQMGEKKDHDGDGDIDSKDYLMAKDKAIKKAMGKEETTEHKEDDDPCWKDYEMVGMKTKNGKKVPNCVPKGSNAEMEMYSEVNIPEGWSVSENVYKPE